MPVDIDLPAVDPGAGDPAAVFGKDAADLVDIHFLLFVFFPDLVDLNSNRKGFFRYHDGIEVRNNCRTEAVAEGFDNP